MEVSNKPKFSMHLVQKGSTIYLEKPKLLEIKIKMRGRAQRVTIK